MVCFVWLCSLSPLPLDPFFILLCTALSQEADSWGSCHPGFPAPWLPDGFDQWKAQQTSGGHEGEEVKTQLCGFYPERHFPEMAVLLHACLVPLLWLELSWVPVTLLPSHSP